MGASAIATSCAPIMSAMLVLLFLAPIVNSRERWVINKCCGTNERLSENGRACVPAKWADGPNLGYSNLFSVHYFRTEHYEWMHHWTPSGIEVDDIYVEGLRAFQTFPFNIFPVANVTVSLKKRDMKYNSLVEIHFVLNGSKSVLPIDHYGDSCIDAIENRSTPFAVIFTIGRVDSCCRSPGELRVSPNGEGECPSYNSRLIRTAMQSGSFKYIKPYRFVLGDPRAKEMYKQRVQNFYFSTRRIVCGDYELMSNGTVRETFLLIDIPHIMKGIYNLLRPVSFVCVSLLLTALAAILTEPRMRTKAHGWALACHASCLLAFNLGQVFYYINFSDDNDINPRKMKKDCLILGLAMYFSLTAAGSWLTAICLNMILGFRRLRMTGRGGGSNEKRRFVILSIIAWGFPTILTIASGLAFRNLSRPWTPSFIETRTCSHNREETEYYNPVLYEIPWHGMAIFYYLPVCTLVMANIVFLGGTLRKVQFLRKGNSVLRREEDVLRAETDNRVDDEQGEEISCWELISKSKGRRRRGGWKPSRASSTGGHRLTIYIKFLLMSGALEFAVEILVWNFSPLLIDQEYFSFESTASNKYAYRVAGYTCDFFRAVGVAWLAAPDGGYWNSCSGWLQRWWLKRSSSRCYRK